MRMYGPSVSLVLVMREVETWPFCHGSAGREATRRRGLAAWGVYNYLEVFFFFLCCSLSLGCSLHGGMLHWTRMFWFPFSFFSLSGGRKGDRWEAPRRHRVEWGGRKGQTCAG